MAQKNLLQGINDGLRQAMEKDPRVVVLGEDVGLNGGVFRVTEGLQKQFGAERVVDTPLAELGIVGATVGLALAGMRPICEIQFDGFLPAVMDQVICHFGRMRNRSQGRNSLPLVLRAPHGGLIHAPEHHSESPEAYFTHTPGIKVVIPSTPEDAKGLLIAAVNDPDPVVYFEPKRLYRTVKGEVPDHYFETPIGKLRVARAGTDITVLSWGAMVHTCLKAAEELEKEGVSCEVVDLRTLTPLDWPGIAASVEKTGRVLVAHEAPNTGSWAGEIAALIHERLFHKLRAPVQRVGAWDIRQPLFQLEKYFIPDAHRVVRGVKKVLSSQPV
ncbi:MAG: pyruvate dehydrogenase E1 component subunit beta [Elusimicrobia bacterium]|nr:MAG: pyruvate dehydrogenase E1 component subunit beta [Elusimicrobiota bacterium]